MVVYIRRYQLAGILQGRESELYESVSLPGASQLGKVTEMVQQIATILMGGVALSLPESLKVELVGTIRKEFECQVQTLKSMHEKEKEELIASFKAQLAARDNEIARLKGE